MSDDDQQLFEQDQIRAWTVYEGWLEHCMTSPTTTEELAAINFLTR